MLEHNGLSVHCPVMYVLPSTNSRGWHGMALIEMDVVLTLWDTTHHATCICIGHLGGHQKRIMTSKTEFTHSLNCTSLSYLNTRTRLVNNIVPRCKVPHSHFIHMLSTCLLLVRGMKISKGSRLVLNSILDC